MRAVVVSAVTLLAACSPTPKLQVADAWVRLSAVPGRPAAAYFTLHGGPTDQTLVAVSADAAVRSEIHESMGGGMRQLARVPVPAGRDTIFAPAGRHVMLFNVNPGLKPGKRRMALTFTFANGTRLLLKATVFGAGEPAPTF